MATVMIVDRAAAQAAGTARLLGRFGLRSVRIAEIEHTIDAVRAERPDLVLMDAFMPEMDGFQMTRRLTRDPELGHIPVVMTAAPDHSAHKVRALWYGARELLFRPIDERAVRDVLLPLIDLRGAVPLRAAAG